MLTGQTRIWKWRLHELLFCTRPASGSDASLMHTSRVTQGLADMVLLKVEFLLKLRAW